MARPGLRTKHFGVAGLGLGQLAKLAQHVAQVVAGLREVGAQADGLAAMDKGLGQLVLLQQNLSEVGLGLGQPGVDLEGAAEVGDPCPGAK